MDVEDKVEFWVNQKIARISGVRNVHSRTSSAGRELATLTINSSVALSKTGVDWKVYCSQLMASCEVCVAN